MNAPLGKDLTQPKSNEILHANNEQTVRDLILFLIGCVTYFTTRLHNSIFSHDFSLKVGTSEPAAH